MELKMYDGYYVYRSGVDEYPSDPQPVSLFAGKNDEAFCNLLVRADDRATLSVGENAAFSKYGMYENFRVSAVCSNPQISVSCKIVGKVPDDAGVNTSDIILNQDYIEMERYTGQQVMILTSVPAEADAGDCTVTVNVYRHIGFAPETLVQSFEMPLHVYDYTVPETKDYRFHLDLWQHNSNIARKHDVMLYSDEHFAVIESYVKSLAAVGQKAVTVIASEIPWSGQRSYKVSNYPSDLYEYNMIRVTRKNGVFEYDYSVMQRYIDLCFANGIDREIEVFGLINIWDDAQLGFGKACTEDPDAVRIRYYDADEGIYRYMDSNEQLAGYVKSLEQYFISTNQIQYVQIVADEPDNVEKYRKSLNRLKEAAPAFFYKVAINHIEFIEEFGDSISDIVPTINFVADKAEYLSKRAKTSKGRTLLYVCCGPDYPNTFLQSPAYEIEVIGYFIYKIGLDGFLRWNYTVWPENPRERLSFRAPGWKAGDTNFVYPGHNGKVLLSLRWYYLKRAIVNYELLSRAAEMDSKIADQIYDTVFVEKDPAAFKTTTRTAIGCKQPEELYAQSPENYLNARKMLLEALEGK